MLVLLPHLCLHQELRVQQRKQAALVVKSKRAQDTLRLFLPTFSTKGDFVSNILIIWISPLVLTARFAEGGKWSGHISGSWPMVMEILTL